MLNPNYFLEIQKSQGGGKVRLVFSEFEAISRGVMIEHSLTLCLFDSLGRIYDCDMGILIYAGITKESVQNFVFTLWKPKVEQILQLTSILGDRTLAIVQHPVEDRVLICRALSSEEKLMYKLEDTDTLTNILPNLGKRAKISFSKPEMDKLWDLVQKSLDAPSKPEELDIGIMESRNRDSGV